MGTMSTIGQNGPSNFKHILFNNGVHDSVGGQPTVADNEGFSFCKIALGCGYKEVYNLSFLSINKKTFLNRNLYILRLFQLRQQTK